MAVDTITVGWHMVVSFSRGGSAIVARCAVINDALVIEPGTSKGSRGVACRAITRGQNVGRVGPGIFASRRDTIVTGGAVIDDAGMIEYGWCKGTAGYVTNNAIIVRGDVIELRILAGCIGSIVTGIASVADNTWVTVVDKRRYKYGRAMTNGTVSACVLMDWRICLSRGPGCNIIHIAIMTGDTVTGDTDVQKRCNRESEISFCVANVTILVGRQVASWFSANSDRGGTEPPVMAAFATPVNRLMFCSKKRCRGKNIRRGVADATFTLRRDMINLFAGCCTRVMANRAIGVIYAYVVKSC